MSLITWASLTAQLVKNLPAMQETQVQSVGWKIPWRRKWQPIPVFLPGGSQEEQLNTDSMKENFIPPKIFRNSLCITTFMHVQIKVSSAGRVLLQQVSIPWLNLRPSQTTQRKSVPPGSVFFCN